MKFLFFQFNKSLAVLTMVAFFFFVFLMKTATDVYLPAEHKLETSWSTEANYANSKVCNMEHCFNYSLCPITENFRVYLYPSIYTLYQKSSGEKLIMPVSSAVNSNSFVTEIHSVISNNTQVTNNPDDACIFIIVLNLCDISCETGESSNSTNHKQDEIPSNLNQQIPQYWFDSDVKRNFNFGGKNHFIWSVCEPCIRNADQQRYTNGQQNSFGEAMVASTTFQKSEFRPEFDLIVSHLSDNKTNTLKLPSLTPARRKYLASYVGDGSIMPSEPLSWLLNMSLNDSSLFMFKLGLTKEVNVDGTDTESVSASEAKPYLQEYTVLEENTDILLNSIFSFIFLNSEETVLTTDTLQHGLYNILKCGAIPVVIGSIFQFPFSEFIDWSKVALKFPLGRLGELHQILKAITDSDIITFRRNGRRVFEKYLSSVDIVVETVLAGVRTRIGVPPPSFRTIPAPSLYSPNQPKPVDNSFDLDLEKGKVKNLTDSLGLLQMPLPSPKFERNITSSLFLDKYKLWNTHFQPFRLLPSTPWDFSVPSEAHIFVENHRSKKSGIRPTFGGDGGDTKQFWKSLGGNIPPEQFTIVMLTYNREVILINKLKSLVGVPYLNSVVVVWNSPNDPWGNLTWPNIGVPIHVIKSEKNSLNNRFLPYDVIETDAILSLDDDTAMSHEEMVFTFRVWRENRDRLVGLPSRFHGWDIESLSWKYVPGRSCEHSMVLTGAAFFHKYYAYMYTFEMPEVIRDHVDRLMNCEDLAMNFLISYLTQKPAIKATGRVTFTCPTCKGSLSEGRGHYSKRNACINTFTEVYGYTTLMYSQFRADSLEYGFNSELQCFSTV